MIIPDSTTFEQRTMTRLLEQDPLGQRYHAFFALFDWSAVASPGHRPIPARQAAPSPKRLCQSALAHTRRRVRLLAVTHMYATFQFSHTYGYCSQRFRCPLLFPHVTGESCEHAQFTKGEGCVKDLNWEEGGLMRALLDREGPLYHAVYTQRTACERINSQAQALGIERPKVRNIRSVRNLNTLIYLVINMQALAKVKSINTGLLQMN
jgi:hypothetical protein